MGACRTQADDERDAHFAREQHHADYCKAHPESLTGSLNPTIAQAFRPMMFARPERRACPSEVKLVIPSIVLTECEAMRKTLNDADRRALERRFTGAALTQPGELV